MYDKIHYKKKKKNKALGDILDPNQAVQERRLLQGPLLCAPQG